MNKQNEELLPAATHSRSSCNCAHSGFPLEWSRYALTWLHRKRTTLDPRCMNPPFEYRLVHKESGEVVDLRPGEKAKEWHDAFPHIYRLERRLLVPWVDATSEKESLAQGARLRDAAGKEGSE